MNISEIFAKERAETRWGNWRLNGSNWTLVHATEGYDIDLEQMNSSSEMLDWIFQINGKPWATPQDKCDLLAALNSIFRPQATLCSGGADSRINAREHLEARYEGIEIPPIEN